MDETLFVGILVDLSGVSTIARSTDVAIDEHLGVNTNGSSLLTVVFDVESISDG